MGMKGAPMTQTQTQTRNISLTGRSGSLTIASQLRNWWIRFRADRRHFRALRELAEAPDWMLDDIGVCRCDVRAELLTRYGYWEDR
jgi:uncharacterized protein YjiS (DUF1127 family)